MEDKFKKWQKWIEIIFEDVYSLKLHQYIFKEVNSMFKYNRKMHHNHFYQFFLVTYTNTVLIGVRRHTKIDTRNRKSVSLAKLLHEITRTPRVISRTRYIALYRDNCFIRDHAESTFNRFAGKGGKHIKSSMVTRDLARLDKKAKVCEKYTDMRIAHYDDRPVVKIPKFKDLDDCIKLLEKLVLKYKWILKAEWNNSLLSAHPFSYDWKDVFRERWLKKNANLKWGRVPRRQVPAQKLT